MSEKNELTLTNKQIDNTINSVKSDLKKIEKSYLGIAPKIAKLKNAKAFLETGDKNIYDLCAREFGMGRGTVSNLCTMVAKFYDSDYKLLPQYENYNFSQLRELLRLTDEQLELLEVNSDMTTKEIKEKVDNTINSSDTELEEEKEEISNDKWYLYLEDLENALKSIYDENGANEILELIKSKVTMYSN